MTLLEERGVQLFPEVEETPPTFESEPVVPAALEKGKAYLKKVKCPICGQEISSFRMVTHYKYKHPDGDAKEATAPKEKAPAAEKPKAEKRVKADEILTTAITAIGGLLASTGISAPTGMALALEGGLLAAEFDKAAAGTIVDKTVLQPIVKAKGRWEGVGQMAAFPIMVFALDKNPQMLPVLYPVLRASMKGLLPGLVAQKRRDIAEERKAQEAAAEYMALEAELVELQGQRAETEGMDPIDAMLQSLFASKVPDEPPAPEEPGSAWEPHDVGTPAAY